MARGIERREIFADDRDRSVFLDRLGDLAIETTTPVYAWCLVPNHFHLLLRSGAAPLSTLMLRLLTAYAVYYNRRHRRSGCLFQNRFKSIVVQEEPYFLELLRYIHLNPVRAGLVEDLQALGAYPWSGHANLIGLVRQPWQESDFVLAQFGRTLDAARASYRAFVAAGVTQGRRSDLVGGGLRRSFPAWQFVDGLKRGREGWAFDERVLGSSDFVRKLLDEAPPPVKRPDPALVVPELMRRIAERHGLAVSEVVGNSHRPAAVAARAVISYIALRNFGLSPTDVARELGVSRYSVLRGFERAQQLGMDIDTELVFPPT
jgi:REP element-mobilizing transposase RayT